MEPKTSFTTNTSRFRREIANKFADIKPVWPFFGLLTLAMAVIYVLTLINVPSVRQPWVLVGFSLLMLLHTGLHWLSPLVGISGKRSAVYLLVQMTLVMSLIALVQYETMFYTLFLGLIGELLGVVRPLRRSLVAIFCLIGIMLITHGIFFRWETTLSFIITMGPLTFFIVIYVYLFTRQLEERMRAENLLEDLEIAHQQLSEYAIRIEELTLTNERQRMARELHDTLSQGLAGVILQLEAAVEHQEKGRSDKVSAIILQAITRSRSTLAEARQVIEDLRENTQASPNLQDFINVETGRFTSLTGLPCEVVVAQNLPISNELKQQIEKIISEGLTNIARHAHASRSWVKLAIDGEKLQLEIGDDGQGITTEQASSNGGHYGLVGIRERVRLYGGTIKIESHIGEGTRLLFTFPLGADGKVQ
jgi:NarL family two-component system sensor histidine kinase YdfH